ncbi:facilitated trehalose transporter Tret1-like [Oratosquilla oratoria]|uniref:facilitated trehalose transporter Tret1-like n=1 Tax=Oratosquilla oratoria TaxID=337810 RepID=UPI003F75C58A
MASVLVLGATKRVVHWTIDCRPGAVIVTAACCLGPLACGFSFAFSLGKISTGLPTTHTYLSPAWNAYAFVIGSVVGGFFSGVVINHGRKVAFWFGIIPFSLSWTVAIFATQVWTCLLFHATAGIGAGLLTVITQVYVAEVSHPRVRGAISSTPFLAYCIGMLLCFSMAEVMARKHLAVLGFCLCFPYFLSLILCIPESPRFLIRNKPDEALVTLQWLRGTESDVSEEYHDISDSCEQEKWRFSCEDLIRPTFWRPMMVSTGLMVLFGMTGIVSFALYGFELFHDVTDTYINTDKFVLTSVYIIATTVSLLLVDHIGRKLLLLLSLTIMAASAFVLGLFLFLKDLHSVRNYFLYQWVAEIFCVLLFIFSHGIGLGPIAWVTMGEIFGSKLKWLSVSVVSAIFWSSLLAADALNHVIQRDVSTGGVFWFHCVTCVGGYIFVLVVFRELKEHRLDDITKCFTRKHDSLIETFIARV